MSKVDGVLEALRLPVHVRLGLYLYHLRAVDTEASNKDMAGGCCI